MEDDFITKILPSHIFLFKFGHGTWDCRALLRRVRNDSACKVNSV